MDTISHRLNLLTLTWLLILAAQGAVGTSRADRGECPPDVIERLMKCTNPLQQKKTGDRAFLTKHCRALKQAPICLKRILDQCQGHAELGPVESLKSTISELQTRFDRVCEPLCGPNAKAVSSSDSICHKASTLAVFSVWLLSLLAL